MSLTGSNLIAGYSDEPILGPLDISVQPGEFVCLIGANGAGKSTLIRTLCGMQRAVFGTVSLGGKPLSSMSAIERAQRLSVVLTDRVAAPLMTGRELVQLGRYPHIGWSGRLEDTDHAHVQIALEQAGAVALAERQLSQMSDGERQKIMVARALAQQTDVLVLDEATAFLDLPRRIETMQLLLDLSRRRRIAIVLSTHDLELALRYADTLWLIDGDRELHVGAPEDLAMNGSLAAAFASDGLTFDLETAELRLGRIGTHPVRLDGAGMAFVWARRALQRAGYQISPEASMSVFADDARYVVHVNGDISGQFDTLGAMVAHLSQMGEVNHGAPIRS